VETSIDMYIPLSLEMFLVAQFAPVVGSLNSEKVG
jgi:hypothetical protein